MLRPAIGIDQHDSIRKLIFGNGIRSGKMGTESSEGCRSYSLPVIRWSGLASGLLR
jgi:hypothetical protein